MVPSNKVSIVLPKLCTLYEHTMFSTRQAWGTFNEIMRSLQSEIVIEREDDTAYGRDQSIASVD